MNGGEGAAEVSLQEACAVGVKEKIITFNLNMRKSKSKFQMNINLVNCDYYGKQSSHNQCRLAHIGWTDNSTIH